MNKEDLCRQLVGNDSTYGFMDTYNQLETYARGKTPEAIKALINLFVNCLPPSEAKSYVGVINDTFINSIEMMERSTGRYNG